jgi:hypothetical protein
MTHFMLTKSSVEVRICGWVDGEQKADPPPSAKDDNQKQLADGKNLQTERGSLVGCLFALRGMVRQA